MARNGNLTAERVVHSGDDLVRQQRVAPQVEEVAVDAHFVDAENLAPDLHQLPLRLRARSGEGLARLGPNGIGRR